MSRILFVADPHGADAVLRKSLQAVHEYDISLYILAGDLAGKDIRAIVEMGDGSYLANHGGRQLKFSGADLAELEQSFSWTGHYYFRCNQREFESLKENGDRIERLIDEKTLERMERWVEEIVASVNLTKTRVLVTPGNDDIEEIDDVLRRYESRGILCHLNQPVSVGAHEVITLDYTNLTPWHTPREVPESKLHVKIEECVRQLVRPERAIFNFHCPPIKTKLDLAPELNGDLKPVVGVGATSLTHVGSSAVRAAIERHQPLLGLHGHVHESPGEDRIGRTLCLNPGSEYYNGAMHAYVIEVNEIGDLHNYHRIER